MPYFSSILIANRGEIAKRICDVCRRLGIHSVVVYTDADAKLPFVQCADTAIRIGEGPVQESYLNIPLLVELAKKHTVQAVHPGYGFLSENAMFAEALAEAKITFIGPSPHALRLTGDKILCKELATRAGLPLAKSFTFPSGSSVQAESLQNVHYPLLVKAAHGGGGRGIRIVHSVDELESSLAAARAESRLSFGKDDVFLEEYVHPAKHVEVQLLGDAAGSVQALGTRDCSAQRRHQKIIEEAPAMISPALEERIIDDACRLLALAQYQGLATAEFLIDDQERAYFLEINSRIQVEHPVTEEIFGIDLLEIQIALASGVLLQEILPKKKSSGHSLECRICAENVTEGFLPASGPLQTLHWTGGITQTPGTRSRFDLGYREGNLVSTYYDSLLGKLIVWGESRERAITEMRSQLAALHIFGIDTNIPAHLCILNEEFELGKTRVHHLDSRNFSREMTRLYLQASLCWYLFRPGSRRFSFLLSNTDVIERPLQFRFAFSQSQFLARAFRSITLRSVPREGKTYSIAETLDAAQQVVLRHDTHILQFESSGDRAESFVEKHVQDGYLIKTPFGSFELFFERPDVGQREQESLLAPLPGILRALHVSQGSSILEGQVLYTLESMKMEIPVRASRPGVVALIHKSLGAQVARGESVLELENES